MQISQVMMYVIQSTKFWWNMMKKDVSVNLGQWSLILCSKILLNVLKNTSLTYLLPWKHTGFQTFPIIKTFLATLIFVNGGSYAWSRNATSFPGPCPYLECGAGKGPGIGWSRAYLNIHKNANVWIPVVNSAFWLVEKIFLELNILGKVRV